MKPGDYIIRGDQPYRTVADMYFSVQNYAPSNPRPYDDTGWTFQLMRNLVIKPIDRQERAHQQMARAHRRRQGAGRHRRHRARCVIVDHTTDNTLVTFRFKHADVTMEAAEEEFEAAGRKFRAGRVHHPGTRTARRSSRR